ncbi:CopG family transcriptional regulator [Aeromonas sp. QDB03]|uniref:ribbon-helix-helix domain-containing protein n=1 Tax=Aeromonas sp. QDB03 TaxID=2989839 RepID=UPI0022DEDEF1|nr:CopG family transcriptional regulator [Aeromonas sp. QDB03]
MKRNLSKVSVTLPPDLVESLDQIASRLGVSRSALISDFLSEAVGTLRPLLDTIPLSPTEADKLRFRGESEEVIKQRLESLKGMIDDLLTH